MKNRNLLYLTDILESMTKIDTYTEGVEFDSFSFNPMMIDAVIRNLEIIGEASRNVSEDIRNKFPEIPWKQMIGLRNILIHEYFGVDESIVWQIIKNNLPDTKQSIEEAIREAGDIT